MEPQQHTKGPQHRAPKPNLAAARHCASLKAEDNAVCSPQAQSMLNTLDSEDLAAPQQGRWGLYWQPHVSGHVGVVTAKLPSSESGLSVISKGLSWAGRSTDEIRGT